MEKDKINNLIPIREKFKPKRKIEVKREKAMFENDGIGQTWREQRAAHIESGGVNVNGRGNDALKNLFVNEGVDYIQEWKNAIDTAAQEGQKECWVVDVGAGTGIIGFELVAAARGEKLENNQVAEEIVDHAKEGGVKLNYVGITEIVPEERELKILPSDWSVDSFMPTETTSAVVKKQQEEKTIIESDDSEWASAINIAYTIDYQGKEQRLLSEIFSDFGGISPRIILANHFFQYVFFDDKNGVLKDIAKNSSSKAILLSLGFEAVGEKEGFRQKIKNLLTFWQLKTYRPFEKIIGTNQKTGKKSTAGLRFK